MLYIDKVPHSAVAELDANLQECVKILNGYISKLRTYLRKYPWLEEVEIQTPASETERIPGMTIEDDWETCSVEVGASISKTLLLS